MGRIGIAIINELAPRHKKLKILLFIAAHLTENFISYTSSYIGVHGFMYVSVHQFQNCFANVLELNLSIVAYFLYRHVAQKNMKRRELAHLN